MTLLQVRENYQVLPCSLLSFGATKPWVKPACCKHEYSLRARLDPEWAVVPLDLVSHTGRTVLVLDDPGGEPLNRLLEAAQLFLAAKRPELSKVKAASETNCLPGVVVRYLH